MAAEAGSTYVLKVHIHDGKRFGMHLQAVQWAAAFNGETKLTACSVGTDYHVWNTTFMWSLDREQLRRVRPAQRGAPQRSGARRRAPHAPSAARRAAAAAVAGSCRRP